jgi:CubicO group peptidase (beta-lactamase class C family)
MSKPVTAVAALMLYERGAFDLVDPIDTWIPEFANPRVYVSGDAATMQTAPASEPIRVWHLLTHTAGLTYGFNYLHPVDEAYRLAGYDWSVPSGSTNASVVADVARLPLRHEPGTAFNYSVATDVLGRLVELWSGVSLREFFHREIFGPLGMIDTDFGVADDNLERLAQLYVPGPAGLTTMGSGTRGLTRPSYESGGGGLVSSAHDYHRFMNMLARGGELDGVRLLSPATVALMSENHLPGALDIDTLALDSFKEPASRGMGHGLGVAMVASRAQQKLPISEGSIMWGGAASTTFWIDPAQDLTAAFYTQLLPSSTYPIRRMLAPLVYQALLD